MDKIINSYIIGNKIKELRIKKNLTQRQLAARLELSSSAVSAYELGLAVPPPETVCELCIIFDIHADDLLGLEERKWMNVDELTEHEVKLLESLVILFRKDQQKSCIPK